MSDKLRRTFPLRITFADGERPSPAKLTGIAEQSRDGLQIVERAIGDLWTQSGDAVHGDFPLQIPNLARLIGENKYLNPAIYPLQYSFTFREKIGLTTAYLGKTEGYLTFKPKAGTIGSGGTQTWYLATYDQWEDYEYNVASGTDYWVDENTGRFKVGAPLTITSQLEYEVDPTADWNVNLDTLPGIIPDPRQSTFTGCRVEQAGTAYHLHLPPRQPLDIGDSLTASGVSDYEGSAVQPAKYPGRYDRTQNYATLATGTKRYWQNPTSNALDHAHYRYHLPRELHEGLAALNAGDVLSQGALYLYDLDTKTIIEDAVFRKPSNGEARTWILEVSSDTFPFSAVVTTDESETSYNSTNLALITCGSPVARTIFNLRNQYLTHDHDNVLDMSPPIQHKSLDGVNPSTDHLNLGHYGRYPNYLPPWTVSRWDQDDHSSLLSRGGTQTTDIRKRDHYNNAMLGHLMMSNADVSGADNYLDGTCPDGSFKVYFGDTDGPSLGVTTSGLEARCPTTLGWPGIVGRGNYGIWGATTSGIATYGEATDGGIGVKGTSNSGSGVSGRSISHYGVFASSTSNYGLYGLAGNAAYYGVRGYSAVGGGVQGEAAGAGKYGVYAESAAGDGLYAITNSISHYAIYAFSAEGGGIYVDVEGAGRYAINAVSESYHAIYSTSLAGGHGVYGKTSDADFYGVYGSSTTGGGVKGYTTGAGKSGVYGQATIGYGVSAFGDTTNPTYAALHIEPQTSIAGPSTAVKGNIWIDTTSGILHVYTGSEWKTYS